ncbi:hypothetical protein LIER_28417 [Lithospermum erythrorhizon]|uniref:Protein FAR1-RELATED SEQUENCE n=1 Tax=Lithospermum erythrorhizon TaxID=34254 RepID=A0AAV3RFM4_LITER
MDIDLRLPSGDHENIEESNGIVPMLDSEAKPHNLDGLNGTIVVVGEEMHSEDGLVMETPIEDMVDTEEDILLEPLAGMEFNSHGEAYAFYQEYARTMGFNTAIQNSRRSKTTREFIDAKFACSRYGTKREYDKSLNRSRGRQGNKQDPDSATTRKSCAKTDCKASMHVKRRPEGKWIIHKFEKEHNHELLPAQAVSEQTRRMYAAMAKQFAEYKHVVSLRSDPQNMYDKSRNLVMDVVDSNILLEFFTQMQATNSHFFYAVGVNENQRLKNFLWVDSKSRYDYINFNDVVCVDTTYLKSKYKMPLVLFVGVNQHYQFMLLGCALVTDESEATFSWVMKTWLRAMGGQSPGTIITDHDRVIKEVVVEVFPSTRHYYCLWNILGKVSETLHHIVKENDKFVLKFEKCVYRSWTAEVFEKRWKKLVEKFELPDNELIQSLYEDRTKWAPSFMRGILLCGMSTIQRSDSVNSYFDKYVHKKTTLREFLKQYEVILQDRYEEEAKADFDTWNKQHMLKSPSPFEKQAVGVYTHAVFKKFQVEVLGAVACHPKELGGHDDRTITYRVQDFEKNQEFTVIVDKLKSEVSCICHLFEFRGFLCRHALIVLQICGIANIPMHYLLKRWTKDSKSRYLVGAGFENVQSRLQRYNDLCARAVKLGEEGSLSQESYVLALRALDDAFGNCVALNTSKKNLAEPGTSTTPPLLSIVEDEQSRGTGKSNKKKNPSKKRKVPMEPNLMTVTASEVLQPMDKMPLRPINVDGYFGSQQGVQGMVQLNLMGPTRENFYSGQQSIQGLGQLNTVAPSRDSYYVPQSTMLQGQMDFFRSPGFGYGMREESNVRSSQLHDDAPRHA